MIVRRREFIALGSAAAVWPAAARAQQAIPVIGFLGTSSEAQTRAQVAAFQRGLSEMSFAEGKNIAIEFRGDNMSACLPWRLNW